MHTTHSIKHKEIYYYPAFRLFVYILAIYTPVLTELIKQHPGTFIDLCVVCVCGGGGVCICVLYINP